MEWVLIQRNGDEEEVEDEDEGGEWDWDVELWLLLLFRDSGTTPVFCGRSSRDRWMISM